MNSGEPLGPSLALLGELGPLREGVAWLEGVHLATGAPPNASMPEAEGSWGPGRWRVFSGAPADFVVWKGTSPSARRGALFDRDVRVSVFESNIRLLGGLLLGWRRVRLVAARLLVAEDDRRGLVDGEALDRRRLGREGRRRRA